MIVLMKVDIVYLCFRQDVLCLRCSVRAPGKGNKSAGWAGESRLQQLPLREQVHPENKISQVLMLAKSLP